MKILFPFIGDSIGGSHKSAIDYYIELKKKKIETKILLFDKNSYLAKYLNSKKIKFDVLELPIIDFDRNIARKFYKLIQGFRRARKYLKKNKIKIVHTNDIRNHYSWAIWSLFLTTHIWHQRTVWPKSIQFYFFLLFTNKIFCNSRYLFDQAKLKYIKKKISIVSNIFYKEKNYKSKKSKKIVIGSFSNIQNIKRPDVIIKILKTIITKKLNVEIHCFGTDKNNLLKKYSEKILFKNNFKFFGHQLDVKNFMKKCDFVIATSENDTLGRTILEAMSLGIPVFATKMGGHKYIIKDNTNGFLFDIENENILKQILFVNQNKILKKKIINNAFSFLDNFSKDKILLQLMNGYEA